MTAASVVLLSTNNIGDQKTKTRCEEDARRSDHTVLEYSPFHQLQKEQAILRGLIGMGTQTDETTAALT